MLTAQELLLQQRIASLDTLEAKARSTSIQNTQGFADRDDLLRDIAKQRDVLKREAAIREDYRRQAEAMKALDDHEKLKATLRETQKSRSLTNDELNAYAASTAHCMNKAGEAGLSASMPIDVQSIATQARERKAADQSDYAKLVRENADLYRSIDKVGDPCVPCFEKRLAVIQRNAEQKRRAVTSSSKFSGKQKHKDTCALMSVQGILLERDGKAPPEGWSFNPLMWGVFGYGHLPEKDEVSQSARGDEDMIDIGKRSGAYAPCNGTSNVTAVMNAAGIPSTETANPSLEDIAQATEEGKAVVIGYDARPVWYGADETKWTSTKTLGHAVRVTAVERNPDGSVRGFYINDSGSGQAGQFVPAENMQKALDRFSPHSTMSSSNSPVPSS